MDEKLLTKLLHEHQEKDWLEFKGKLKLYQSDGTLVPQQRDEFIKDILGLANGNSHIIRKTKYLIIGADNENFDDNGCRMLHNVDYRVPSRNDIAKWLAGACAPAIVGLESETISFPGVDLFVVTIPPAFNLHETTHELKTPGGTFQKHTVFMRQDENTVPASVSEGITIQQLKQLYRQEISNPSAIWFGALVGGIVAFIIGGAKVKAGQSTIPFSDNFIQSFFTALGVFFGSSIGWITKQWNETRYAWRYMTLKQRIITLIAFIVTVAAISYVMFK